jgi:hypothetical protein
LHATGAVEFVALEDVVSDETFRVRPDGDISVLATSLGRLGQFVPVELRPWPGAEADRPRWQVVAGFRRMAAVRLLARERVLARLHVELSDDDAWGLALADALLQQPLSGAELRALRDRLRATGTAPWAEELVEEALVRAPVDEELRERFYEFLTQAGAVGAGTGGEAEAAAPVPEPATAAPAAAPSAQSRPPASPSLTSGAPPPIPSLPTATPVPTEPVPATPAAAPPANSLADASEPPASPTWDGSAPEPPTPAAVEPAPEVTASSPPTSPGEADGTAHEAIELTCDELARDVAARFSQLDQDLALLYENWADVPPEERRALVEQARYVAELLPFMEEGQ